MAALLQYLDERSADLVVLATHQRAGLTRWLHRSIAEPVARRAGAMTLFLPQDVTGFIALDNGAVTLRRILIPIDQVPRPQPQCMWRPGLAHTLAAPNRLHTGACWCHRRDAGGPRAAPRGLGLGQDVRRGDVARTDSRRRHGTAADLIGPATRGHQSFLDTCRGSTSERILRGARCPVLVIPAA